MNGIDTTGEAMSQRINKDALMLDLIRVTNLLGHAPSYEEMREHGEYSPPSFRRHLGPNWKDVKARVGWKPTDDLSEWSIDSLTPKTVDG